MEELSKRWHPDDWEVLAAFWQAIINVYGPWTEPGHVSSQEQWFAHRRVERAREQLGVIANRRVKGGQMRAG